MLLFIIILISKGKHENQNIIEKKNIYLYIDLLFAGENICPPRFIRLKCIHIYLHIVEGNV